MNNTDVASYTNDNTPYAIGNGTEDVITKTPGYIKKSFSVVHWHLNED